MGQYGLWTSEPDRCDRPHDRVRVAGRPHLSTERANGDAVRETAWMAPRREASGDRRQGVFGEPLRLRPLRVPQRPSSARARVRSVPVPPEAREPSRGAVVERRLRARSGAPRDRARDDEGNGPDRDGASGVRDG